MKLIPYLYFGGNARAALEFYQQVFNGTVVSLSTFSDGPPDMPVPEGFADKIMHARLEFGDCVLYFSDGPGVEGQSPHSLTIEFDDVDAQTRAYEALKQGGTVEWELQDTFWGARYGKLTDKFGMNWDLNYQYPEG
ncbi:MAG: VOC family protein [Saprospiraceae bacterium]|nr:VOC family protein [Saprospiraceae bacterium]